MEILKDTKVYDILDQYGDIADVMETFGIKRVGTYSLRRIITRFITVERAARIHKVPLDEMLASLRKAMESCDPGLEQQGMLETHYRYTSTESLTMEKIIDDERVAINHIVVPPGGSVPTHASNSFVHQIVVRGTLSLSLEDREYNDHPAGSIVSVPFNLKMSIRNRGDETLEFFVLKAPNPRDMPAAKDV